MDNVRTRSRCRCVFTFDVTEILAAYLPIQFLLGQERRYRRVLRQGVSKDAIRLA